MDYTELCTFETLYAAYKTARVGKREKVGTAQFEANALAYIERIAYLLSTGQYRPGKFETFYVYEPKKRLVQAPAFRDKVVQHALVDNILYDALTRSFIQDSHASQIGKGMHVGLKRLQGQMRDYYLKRKGHDEAERRAAGLPPRPREEWTYAEGWILKADVRHFFASIDHDILKAKLRKRLKDPRVYELMCVYIDSTNGLPLGYQTSQLLALMYLDDFDHWVKEDLHAKYYGRYMDDFYIICDSKERLQEYRARIEQYMAGIKLELNEKTAIFPLRNGINFLGFHTYLDSDGGVVLKLRRDSIKRMKNRIRFWREDYPAGKVSRDAIIRSWKAWDAHAAHGDTYALRQKIAAEVSAIVGVYLHPRPRIRTTKNEKAWKLVKQLQRTRKKAPAPPAPPVPTGFPW
nr:reverse transcriptase/maturase family protein [uncultured Dysosmobacter sp.]